MCLLDSAADPHFVAAHYLSFVAPCTPLRCPTSHALPAALLLADATADEALEAFSAHWRETALALRATREQLAKVPMLGISPDRIDAVAAEARGVTLLCPPTAVAGARAKLGVFPLPAINTNITQGPKGAFSCLVYPLRCDSALSAFCWQFTGNSLTASSTCVCTADFPLAVDNLTFFFEEQRTALTQEFIAAMIAQLGVLWQFGVLISGPNGVGKTSVGVQTFLTCFAQAMLVVYIPFAAQWVTAAKRGEGDKFFIERLLSQNADLIAADPVLREALAPALRGGPLDAAVMSSLASALKKRPGPVVGVIVDEAQAITFAIRDGMDPKADPTERTAAAFLKQWHTWTDATNVFVRMDIASSHGARELKLPSGEARRLRIIKPWTADVVAAALSESKSPTVFKPQHRRVSERLAFITGGIPRMLFKGKQLFADGLAEKTGIDAALAYMEGALESAMTECCSGWFATLREHEKQRAADNMLQLVRGEVPWDRVKGLYDDGLVARCGTGAKVTPVSPVAASIIIGTLAEYRRGHRKPLALTTAGDQRGHELELQTLAALEAAHVPFALGAKGFDGNPATRDVSGHAHFAIVFDSIPKDVTEHATRATLYIPHSDQFPCDAITVPASSSDAATPIVVWETSVTEPKEREEGKLDNMFAAGGIIPQLQAAHPPRDIVIALCWDGDLLQGNVSAMCRRWLAKASAASTAGTSVTIVVVDRAGLQRLGVLA
jgi:hypothetical protein